MPEREARKPVGLWGTVEAAFTSFLGGLVRDTDAAALAESQASDAQNVDMEPTGLLLRKGRLTYNAAAPVAAPVRGVGAFYPSGGTGRTVLMQAGTSVYADTNRNGSFGDAGEAIQTGLTGGVPMDFLQFHGRAYFGSSADGLFRWTGSGTAAAAGNPAAPGAPTATVVAAPVLEAMAAGAFTTVGSHLTPTYVTGAGTAPENELKLTADTSAAVGSYVHRTWSTGATVDLSSYASVTFLLYSEDGPIVVRFGVKDNSGTIVWGDYFTCTKNQWVRCTVPLTGIDPASRNASTGFAVQWASAGGTAYGTGISVFLTQVLGLGRMAADRYSYFQTYTAAALGTESAPSPAAVASLSADVPYSGVRLVLGASLDASVDGINLYRTRDLGTFAFPERVGSYTNASHTVIDTAADVDMELAGAAELRTQTQVDPPPARTYCVVQNRLFAGGVTVAGTSYPYRLYISRLGRLEGFDSSTDVTDPTAGGWLDLADRDPIRRIAEMGGTAFVFCDRSVWTVQGTGFADYAVLRRAAVGLDAREAVAQWERFIFFLSSDGIRVMLADGWRASGFTGRLLNDFETWVISEPINSLLAAIPPALRASCAMGVDERGRVHFSFTRAGQTEPDAALVFDPRAPGALQFGYQPARPGWTFYTNWGFSCFHHLKRGDGDNGQLLAGDPVTGKVHVLQQDLAANPLLSDDGAALAGYWQGKALDAGTGRELQCAYLAAELDPAPGQWVTLSLVMDRGATTLALPVTLPGATGISRALVRLPVTARCRWAQLRVDFLQTVAMQARGLRLGYTERLR